MVDRGPLQDFNTILTVILKWLVPI